MRNTKMSNFFLNSRKVWRGILIACMRVSIAVKTYIHSNLVDTLTVSQGPVLLNFPQIGPRSMAQIEVKFLVSYIVLRTKMDPDFQLRDARWGRGRGWHEIYSVRPHNIMSLLGLLGIPLNTHDWRRGLQVSVCWSAGVASLSPSTVLVSIVVVLRVLDPHKHYSTSPTLTLLPRHPPRPPPSPYME